jgi:sugar phosphate isomerase/epimerase
MKISCADYAWPLLPHTDVLRLISMLGLEGVDLGLMGNRSHVRPEVVRKDLPYWVGVLKERLDQSGLVASEIFAVPWTDFETMAPNNPDPAQQEESAAFFRDMLDLAVRLGAPGLTILPGTLFNGESWESSIKRSAEALKWRVDAAAKASLRLSVEGHMGSNVDTPEKLAHLVELTPGLELALDYTHYTAQGFTDAEIEPLLDYTGHFHLRGGARGRLQTKFKDNTVDYQRVVQRMKEIGYDGYICLEYVWIDWQGCNETDNVAETIQFRDLVRAAAAGQTYAPVVSPI